MKSTNKITKNCINQIPKNINQGDCVFLKNQEELFQVLGIDNAYEKCWVREWPLNPDGSPVFEISIKQVYSNHRNN